MMNTSALSHADLNHRADHRRGDRGTGVSPTHRARPSAAATAMAMVAAARDDAEPRDDDDPDADDGRTGTASADRADDLDALDGADDGEEAFDAAGVFAGTGTGTGTVADDDAAYERSAAGSRTSRGSLASPFSAVPAFRSAAAAATASSRRTLSREVERTTMPSSSPSSSNRNSTNRGDGDLDSAGRRQALERTMTQIERQFGKGAIMKLESDAIPQVEGISTGALSLDLALGGVGIPRGRVAEFYGPESSGKTTLALHVIASAQKKGGVAAFIDAEHALDPSWARRLGVNIDELLVSQPDTGEQAMEICEMLVRSNAVEVIVVDSVAALIPRAEIEGEMGDSHVGLQARLMSQALRKLTGAISKSHCSVIFINQIREKIGVMFGSPETTPGGRALKFYASVRVDIRRISSIKEGDRATGNRVRARVVKNKIAPPFRDAEFDIMFNEGISASGDLVDLAVTHDIVNKSGAWFSYGDLRLGQGRENAKQFLKENEDLFEEIRRKVLIKEGVIREDAAAGAGGGGGDGVLGGALGAEETAGESETTTGGSGSSGPSSRRGAGGRRGGSKSDAEDRNAVTAGR